MDEEVDDDIKIPVDSIDELKNLEALLATKANKIKLTKKLSLIGGNHSKMLAIRLIDSLLSKQILNKVCWKGTKEKLAIYTNFKNVLDTIVTVVKKRYPTEDVGTLVESVMRHKFKNSGNSKIATTKKQIYKGAARVLIAKRSSPKTLKLKKNATLSNITFFKSN